MKHAEKLLSAQFHEYSNGHIVQAAIDKYSLPQTVSKLIDSVTPTIQLAQSLPTSGSIATLLPPELNLELQQRETSAALKVSCFKHMTPECLRLPYNFPDTANIASHPNNSFGIYETAWSSWLLNNLDLFFTNFDQAHVGDRPTVLAVDGGYLQTDFQLSVFNLEPDLDFQYAISLAGPLPITNIQVSSAPSCTSLHCTVLTKILGRGYIPVGRYQQHAHRIRPRILCNRLISQLRPHIPRHRLARRIQCHRLRCLQRTARNLYLIRFKRSMVSRAVSSASMS